MKQQQLSGLEFLAKISGGFLRDGRVGSLEVRFQPGNIGVIADDLVVEQSTGSVSVSSKTHCRSVKLTFQSLLPVLIFTRHETRVVLRGRTDEQHSPAVDYIKYIFLPFLARHFGIESNFDVIKRSPSVSTDGELIFNIKPMRSKLNCISLRERGEVCSVTAILWNAKQEYPTVDP
jgi:RNA 3'-terminal phosphate cyclase (ATP)